MDGRENEFDTRLNTNVRIARIVVGAMVVGVAVFLGFAVWKRASENKPPSQPVVGLVGIVFAAGALVAAAVVPRVQARTWERQVANGNWPQLSAGSKLAPPAETSKTLTPDEDDVLRWWVLYQSSLVIRCALIEGAAFLQCMAYLLEGNLFSAGIAGGLVVVLLSQWPSRERSDRWVAARLQAVEELQSGKVP